MIRRVRITVRPALILIELIISYLELHQAAPAGHPIPSLAVPHRIIMKIVSPLWTSGRNMGVLRLIRSLRQLSRFIILVVIPKSRFARIRTRIDPFSQAMIRSRLSRR
jgi:hypothetical protein